MELCDSTKLNSREVPNMFFCVLSEDMIKCGRLKKDSISFPLTPKKISFFHKIDPIQHMHEDNITLYYR